MKGCRARPLASLLVLTCIFQGWIEGVLVLRFQEDRVARLDSLAWYNGTLSEDIKLSSVSLCARFTLFTLHAWATFFMLTNERDEQHILEGDLWVERVRPVFARNWNFQILRDKLWVYRWHHLCFTYDHLQHLINTYVDGELSATQLYDVRRTMAGTKVKLGQGSKKERSFSGDLSQVNVWDRALTEDEVRSIASCEADLQGNYVSWDVGWTLQNITSYDIPLSAFCQQERWLSYFWFPQLPHTSAMYLCQALGSHLPTGTDMEVVWDMLNVSHAILPANDSCYTDFWTALTDEEEEGVWRIGKTPVDSQIAWAPQEPNGLQYENCGSVVSYGVSDVDCKSNSRCVVCTISEQQRFSFLGTCEDEVRNVFFTAFQTQVGELTFIGYGAFHITKREGVWVWVNVVKNFTIAYMQETEPDFPMGRRWWRLKRPVCGQKPGGLRELLLSPCPPDHFTCDDASCIPLPQRCDLKYDCRDLSDEVDCRIVAFPDGYQKHLPPRHAHNNEESLPITLSIHIEALNVKTIEMTMDVSYILDLTWMDSRLLYQNLKVNSTLNILPPSTMTKLWAPEVGFINVITSEHTLIDDDTTMHIERLEDAVGRDDAVPFEVEQFPGRDNPIQVSRKYGTVFLCDLDLGLYPFDVQECFMHLRLTSATRSFIVFDSASSSVVYSASTLLVEYEIGDLTLIYGSTGSYSEARVRIPLKRRYGYAILNIYLPTLVLLIVSYVTLFFRADIFDVRMMSALTVQLVIATLFSQVSSTLPKTSYFKMVDVWLIFCIGITFLTIIFHVVVDDVVNRGRWESGRARHPTHPRTSDKTNGTIKIVDQTTQAWRKPKEAKKHGMKRHIANVTCIMSCGNSNGNRDNHWILMATKVAVAVVCLVFNLAYWSYLFG